MRLQERRRELGIEQLDLANKVGTNAPMMSNFEHYKCVPTPEMLTQICKELKCEPLDIYDRKEIFIDHKKVIKMLKDADTDVPKVYKLTVALPNSARAILTQENLEKCGYQTLKEFIWNCVTEFEKIVNTKKEKTTQLTTAKVVLNREM